LSSPSYLFVTLLQFASIDRRERLKNLELYSIHITFMELNLRRPTNVDPQIKIPTKIRENKNGYLFDFAFYRRL